MDPPANKKATAIAATVLALLIGAAVGLGGYTFAFARGYAYLQDDPAACANCHAMGDHYAGWIKSSHRNVATCNDCHTPGTPAANLINKIDNGFWHGLKFTTGDYPANIRIRAHNREVTEASCRNCHADLVVAMDAGHAEADRLDCIRCHGSVGHP